MDDPPSEKSGIGLFDLCLSVIGLSGWHAAIRSLARAVPTPDQPLTFAEIDCD